MLSVKVAWKRHRNPSRKRSPTTFPKEMDLKRYDGVDEGSLEVLSRSKKTNSNDSSEGNGVAVKDSKEHDVVDEDRLEVPAKSKKKTNSNKSSKARVPSWIAFGWNPCCCYGVLVASIPCCQHSE